MSAKRKNSPVEDGSPLISHKKSKLAKGASAQVNGRGKGTGTGTGKHVQVQEDPPSELDQDTLRQFQRNQAGINKSPLEQQEDDSEESELEDEDEEEEEDNFQARTLAEQPETPGSETQSPNRNSARNFSQNQAPARKSSSHGTSRSEDGPLAKLPREALCKYLPSQIESVRKVLAGGHPEFVPVDHSQKAAQQKKKEQEKGKEVQKAPQALKTECVGLEAQRSSLNLVLEQTVKKGQSNSALMIGAGGCGKSLLLNSVLSSLSLPSVSNSGSASSSANSKNKDASKRSFYHVSLSAVLQPTDRLAMRELARQLIEQGAFGEGEISIDDDEDGGGENQDQDPENLNADQDEDEELRAALQIELEDEEERNKEEIQRDRTNHDRNGTDDGQLGKHAEEDEDEDEEEGEAEDERERRILEENRLRIEEMKRVNLENAMMSSLANTMSSIMSLLSPQDPSTHSASIQSGSQRKTKKESDSRASLPLIISLDSFDLFTSRPRQALLYCLLDTVQSGSYTAGLAVIGMTRRVDTVDLLEKRVKSRFSHRLIHVVPPASEAGDNWKHIVKQALLTPFKMQEDGFEMDKGGRVEKEMATFRKAWSLEVDELFKDPLFSAVLHDCWEISGDVREMYRILMRGITHVSINEPALEPIFFASAFEEDAFDLSMAVLNELTTTEFALLIASKHLTLRSIPDFTFEQCLDEVKRFERKMRRDLESSGAAGFSSKKGKEKSSGREVDEMKLEGEDRLAHRERAMMAFQSLLSLSIFVPTSSLSSLSIPIPSVHAHSTSTLNQAGAMVSRKLNSSRLEYVKVRCSIEIGEIKQALNAKARFNKDRKGSSSSSGGGGGIRDEVLKWGLSMATT